MMSAGGTGAVVRAGHLRKLKTMKKKFFVLRAETADCSARLEYYESEKKFRSGAAPRRVLSLKSCYNITRRLDLKQKHVIALFTREEQLCVVAENETDLHGWLTAILKHHRNEDGSEELLHPIQHVWQVNVQKKGLGASKNIQGLYNLCLTDQTLTLVKIKSQNNVISDLGIPERVEYTLKNIRRCGDSECFFYMEVGRQTGTGAGELWMHTDDANIAQSMHSTIYHAMRNCAKEHEHERDHIVIPKAEGTLPARRQTYDSAAGRKPLHNERGCIGACLKPCVCADDSAVPLAPHNDTPPLRSRCDSMPSRGSHSLEQDVRAATRHDHVDGPESRDELDAEWHRTPRIPEEPDFCDNSRDFFSSLMGSFHHSRTSSMGLDDPEPGYLPMAGPGPEPPGAGPCPPPCGPQGPAQPYLPMSEGPHSPTSGSVCSGTPSTDPRFSEYQLEPATSHIVDADRPPRAYSVGSRPAARGGNGPAASGGWGSEPVRSRACSVGARLRPAARPGPQPPPAGASAPLLLLLLPSSKDDLMELDFSNNAPAAKVVVARSPPAAGFINPSHGHKPVDEYVDMSPRNAGYVEMRPGDIPASSSHPLIAGGAICGLPSGPNSIGPSLASAAISRSPPADGYVEMNYGRGPTKPIDIHRPIDIPSAVQRQPMNLAASPEERRKRNRDTTPLGSQTLFPFSPESPASPPELDTVDFEEDMPHHALPTVSEMSEDGRKSPDVSSLPYVTLAYTKPISANKSPEQDEVACNPTATKIIAREAGDCRVPLDTTATLVLAAVGPGGAARFSVDRDRDRDRDRERDDRAAPASPSPCAPPAPSPCVSPGPLNYADLDLEPRRANAAHTPAAYTQIDFARSGNMAADGN